MNGAIIDRSNTENYGDIIDLNGAGQFELNEILSVESGNLKLKYKIKDGYDFSAVIQFIKVPKVKNLTISQIIQEALIDYINKVFKANKIDF